MHEMKTTDPDIWQEFVNGDFTVNTSNTVPFTRIGVDQAMEHLNKSTKGQGGISGITSYPKTLLKFCLTGPELARLSAETERLAALSNSAIAHQHHCLSQAKVRRQERAIAQLKTVLAQCNIFKGSSTEPDPQAMTGHMFKLLSKEILPNNVKESILSTEQVGMGAYLRFVKERLTGNENLWSKMTKVKLLSWSASAKEIKLNAGSEAVILKATSSLFARMLVIARSSREDIDLEAVIGTHEFAYTNRVLMKPDGSIHPTTDKSTVIHLLENLVQADSDTTQEATTHKPTEEKGCCLIVDGMAVLQELMAVKNFNNCSDLGTSYVKIIDSKARGYDQVRVIFDNYTKVSSLKEGTRERRRGKSKGIRSYIVQDSTCIRDKGTFLASNDTKDSLTLYLAQKLIDMSTAGNLVTVTCSGVVTNSDCPVSTGVSTHEEADTLMILHAVEVAETGLGVHLYCQNTAVLLLALRRVPQLGIEPAVIMGTRERRHKVMLKPIYDQLGPDKASALINWHALTGCDTTGHIQGKGKKGCFTAFLASSPTVLAALAGLGEGAEPSAEVVKGCEEFLCALFCPRRLHITQAKDLRWHLFKLLKPEQGVDKLPPTHGAWLEHIRRAHVQASVWSQDLVLDPVIPNPLELGWQQQDGRLVPVLTEEAPAPDAVLQLTRCSCASTDRTCSGRCSCRHHNLVCTELCHCAGDEDKCHNTQPTVIGQDEEEE